MVFLYMVLKSRTVELPHMSILRTSHVPSRTILVRCDHRILAHDVIWMQRLDMFRIYWHQDCFCVCVKVLRENVDGMFMGYCLLSLPYGVTPHLHNVTKTSQLQSSFLHKIQVTVKPTTSL